MKFESVFFLVVLFFAIIIMGLVGIRMFAGADVRPGTGNVTELIRTTTDVNGTIVPTQVMIYESEEELAANSTGGIVAVFFQGLSGMGYYIAILAVIVAAGFLVVRFKGGSSL